MSTRMRYVENTRIPNVYRTITTDTGMQVMCKNFTIVNNGTKRREYSEVGNLGEVVNIEHFTDYSLHWRVTTVTDRTATTLSLSCGSSNVSLTTIDFLTIDPC